MKPVRDIKAEPGEGFRCQLCDTPFVSIIEPPVCPTCGAKGTEWVIALSLQDDEESAKSESFSSAQSSGWSDDSAHR